MFSAVRLELVVELEESLVCVPTVQVVTLLTLWLRTSNWNLKVVSFKQIVKGRKYLLPLSSYSRRTLALLPFLLL